MKYVRISTLLCLSFLVLAAAVTPVDAKDVWTQVRSKNFLLVGNASEKEIRKVGTRLEQFRETFRLVFSKLNFTASVPTNVVVFKSDSSFKNFKPKRADGKIDNFIAGFFQPGEDVNYISLSADGDGSGEATKYSVIFHEYVHFIINTNFGKSKVPAWFNEGLAEYYETFAIENDQKIKLGLPQSRHLTTLKDGGMLPLRTLFGVSNVALLQMSDGPRNIFYSESWALIHYLTQTGKSDALNKFFQALVKDAPPEAAFQDAFQTNYEKMESDLKRYVGKYTFNYNELTLKSKLVFDNDMTAVVIDDADSNAYLGDLLYHMNRADDAEPYLNNAISQKAASSMANTTLGMVKYRQRKFDEAKKYLEAAITADGRNHIAYFRYAYLLSREGQDGGGMVMSFEPAKAAKMRAALNKAIEINPSFTESYELLAFINLVTEEQLDESIAGLQKALRYQPGNQRYALRIAEIYSAQNKFTEADGIANKIAQTTDDPETKARAVFLLSRTAQRRDLSQQIAVDHKTNADALAKAMQSGNAGGGIDEVDPLAAMRSINDALRKARIDERRVIGVVTEIDCKQRPLGFVVKTSAETFTVTSDDFASLELGAFAEGADKAQVGCGENLSALHAVVTYKPAQSTKSGSRGNLISLEFVPADFQFLEPLSDSKPRLRSRTDGDSSTVTSTMAEPPRGRNAEEEQTKLRMMMGSIRGVLPKPAEGQRQDIGFLDKVECSDRVVVFVVRTSARTFRLINSSPQSLRIGVFTPELAGIKFGCSLKPVEVPAIFNYIDKPDAKMKTDGEITALTFVPRGFTLDP